MVPLRLASISERLSSLFLRGGGEEEVEQEKEHHGRGTARRGSYLEYDMEGLEEENTSSNIIDEKLKSKTDFVDSFPILNTPLPLPPLNPKAPPAKPHHTHLPDPAPPNPTPPKAPLIVSPEELESSPNWLPGLPRPPPGVLVEPPRNRSKVARLRYLAQLDRWGVVYRNNNILFQDTDIV